MNGEYAMPPDAGPAWRAAFAVAPLAPGADPAAELEGGGGNDRPACVVVGREGAWRLELRRDADLPRLLPDTGAVTRTLDVTVIESLVVRPLLAAGRMTPTLSYEADARAAVAAGRRGGAAAAVLLRPTRVAQVFAAADAGEFMPPKSTYFAPKVPSGLVIRGARD